MARPTAAVNRIIRALDSDFCRAFAEPPRMDVLRSLILLGGVADITSVAAHVSQDRSVVSRHLKVLLDAGIVRVEKQGRSRIYAIQGREVVERFEHIVATLREGLPDCC